MTYEPGMFDTNDIDLEKIVKNSQQPEMQGEIFMILP